MADLDFKVKNGIQAAGNLSLGLGTAGTYKIDVAAGALGTTVGSQLINLRLNSNTSNADYLEFSELRTSAGTDWTTAGYRIQQKVDATWMAYIQFNGSTNNSGISFGTGSGTASAAGTGILERLRIDASGNVIFGGSGYSGGGTNTGGISVMGKDLEMMTIMGAFL
jgi:hypothetical protein